MKNTVGYSGTPNLEVMEHARHYNAFLSREILRVSPTGGLVVDFGAGNGIFASSLVERGFDVVCVEPDLHLQEQLRVRKLKSIDTLSAVAVGSARFVYALNVLEHIDDDERVLQEMYAVLEPKGVLFLYVPAFPVLFSSMDRYVGHVRRYRRWELIEKLQCCGFRIRSARYADSLGFFVTLLYKMVDNSGGKIRQQSVMLYDRLLFPISMRFDVVCQHFLGKNLILIAVKE